MNRDKLLKLIEMSKKTSSNFEPKCPKGLKALPFQKAGVEYALGFDNVLIADEPGLGKTIQSILLCNEREHQRIIVICPSALKIAPWVREIKKWTTLKNAKVLTLEKFYDIPMIDKDFKGFLIMSFEFAAKCKKVNNTMHPHHLIALKNFKPETVIIDEVHKLKNVSAKRTKLILAKEGLRRVVKNWILLSGTPIENRPIEIYSILKSLMPGVLNGLSYNQFAYKFCGAFMMEVNGRSFLNVQGASNLRNLAARLRAGGMVRRQKSAVLKQLPAKIRNIVFMDDKKKRFAAARYSPKLLSEQEIEFMSASKERAELGLHKASMACDYIYELLNSGHEKIVVFCIHKQVVKTIEDFLIEKKIGVVTLTGSTRQDDRVKAQDSFQKNKNTKVFIGNIEAAGVGITLTAASYVVIVEPHWTPGANEQAEDRVHRIGQDRQVICDYLVVPDTMDEHILKRVMQKEKIIKESLNG